MRTRVIFLSNPEGYYDAESAPKKQGGEVAFFNRPPLKSVLPESIYYQHPSSEKKGRFHLGTYMLWIGS